MKKLSLKVFLLSILICIASALEAQITIGSGESPGKGALLDLKEKADGTSTRGLMLPRVSLSVIDDLDDILSSAEKAADSNYKANHTGLTVYSIFDCFGYGKGVYTWDGNRWEMLQSSIKDQYSFNESYYAPGVGRMTDFEGNEYTTKTFAGTISGGGSYSKTWMTQNLRSLRNAEGQFIYCPHGFRLNPAVATSGNAIVIKTTIPNAPTDVIPPYVNAGTSLANQPYKDFVDEFGLLYFYSQALNICPKGWSLPSAEEWDKLAEMLGGVKGSPHYNGIGNAMKANNGTSYTSIDGVTYTWGNGGASPNGFNAVPTGFISLSSGSEISASSFPRFTYWWTSSNGYYRYLLSNQDYLGVPSSSGGSASTSTFLAVRCVKD